MSAAAGRPAPPPPEDTTATLPVQERVPVVRLVAAGFFVTLLVVLGLRVASGLLDRPAASAPPPLQEVRVRAVDPVRARIVADGQVVHDGPVEAGEAVDAHGRRRIEVWVSDLRSVVVMHDGERVEPLHDVSGPRTLVFVHDPDE